MNDLTEAQWLEGGTERQHIEGLDRHVLESDLVPPASILFDTEAEWLAFRDTGIGGSEAAAALGLSPWCSPWELYHRKVDGLEVEQNEFMYWGKALEPAILERWHSENWELILQDLGEFEVFTHREHPWAYATPDALTEDGEGVVEAKCASARVSWKWEDGAVPDEYLIQAQWYLEVLDREWCEFALLIGGNEYRAVRFERDRELGAELIAKVGEFWQMVQDRMPPDPEAYDRVALLYPDHVPDTVAHIDRQMMDDLHDAEMLKDRIAELKSSRDKILNRLKVAIGDNESAMFGDTRIATYKTNKRGQRTLRLDP